MSGTKFSEEDKIIILYTFGQLKRRPVAKPQLAGRAFGRIISHKGNGS